MGKLLLTKIANYLMMNASFQDDLGLYKGKMGCVLFFAHYSRYTGKLYYADFANELLDEICEELNECTPINFAYGLCGIAWGIEHLVQLNFIQGDTGDILEELNKKIMERDPFRIEDLSFEKGLEGIFYYIRVHTQSPYAKTRMIDTKYLTSLDVAFANRGLTCMNIPHDALNFPDILSQKMASINITSDAKLSTDRKSVV